MTSLNSHYSIEKAVETQRNFIRTLGICKLTLRCSKPKSCAYPKELVTLGDHIRKRRLDLGLLQKQVAEQMGVDQASVVNWEKNHSQPEFRYLPAIIAFLGYDPRPKPAGLPQQLVWFREGKGWSQKRLALELRVDPTTLARWERGERKPWGKYGEVVVAMLEVLESN